MKLSNVAFVLGGLVSMAAAVVGSGACSSSSSSGSQPDSGTATDSSVGGGDTAMPSADADVDAGCGDNPALHPNTPGGGVYCPFGAAADGGDLTLYCGADGGAANVCCIGGENANSTYPPSICSAGTCTFTATSGNTQVQCEDPATDCPAGNVCCGSASKSHTIEQKTGCTYDDLSDWVYTKCEKGTACAATSTAPGTGPEFQLCTSNAECGGGKTCTPFKAKGIDMGYCM